MNIVEAVNILDGNAYIVKSAFGGKVSSLKFDNVYNETCIRNNLSEIFEEAAQEYGVDVNLLKAVGYVESTFRTDAVSKSGAMGVMQLMPYTAQSYGVEDPFDAKQNIAGGAKLLADLMEKYNGNITLSCAAYNAGSGAVDRSGGVPDREQTINYVKKINEVLGGALDKDSWTIEGSEPTVMDMEIIVGSRYAGFMQPVNSVHGGGAMSEYGIIKDGSPYEHYVANSRSINPLTQ